MPRSNLFRALAFTLVISLFVSLIYAATPREANTNAVAKDSSIIPRREVSLTKVSLSDDADHTVDISALGFYPLILQVRADGNFHEGSVLPVQGNDLWRDSGQVWSIPVNGATTWHFMRQSGAGTVTVYVKVLGSN